MLIHSPLDRGLDAEGAERLAAQGLFADDAAGLRAAFGRATELWLQAEARAHDLDPKLLNESVNGEWSFLQTVRHLVFAVDSWLTTGVYDRPADFHPLGVAPAHAGDPSAMGLTLDAQPSLEEVLAVRAGRRAMLQAFFDEASEETLTEPMAGWNGVFLKGAALQVFVYEEAEHLRFANRDLDILTGVTVPG